MTQVSAATTPYPPQVTSSEHSSNSHMHHPQFEHAKHVYVYLNGDRYYPGRKFIVNRKYLHDFDGFLTEVTRGIKPQFGAVRNIYTPTNGSKIQGLEQLENNMELVAGGIEKFRRMGYRDITERPRMMHNTPKKTSTTVSQFIFKVPLKNRLQVPGRWRAYVKEPCQIFVYGNGDIIAPPMKLLLTPRQMKSWDLILQHITEKIGGRTGQAVRKLYGLDYHILHEPQELEAGQFYIAVGTEKLKRLPYGHIPSFTSKSAHPHQISPRRPSHPPLPPINKKASKETYSKLHQRRRLTADEAVLVDVESSRPQKLKRQPQPPTTVHEDESVFHAKPVKVKRSPQLVADEEDQGTIFRGGAVAAEEADEVREDENTKVNIPIDQVPAARVEEEIITNLRDNNDSVIIGTDENANNIKESLEESGEDSYDEEDISIEEDEGIEEEYVKEEEQEIEEDLPNFFHHSVSTMSVGSFPALIPAASATSHATLVGGYPSQHQQMLNKSAQVSKVSSAGSSHHSKFSSPNHSLHSSADSLLEEEEVRHCNCVERCTLACPSMRDNHQDDDNRSIRKSFKVSNLSLYKQEAPSNTSVVSSSKSSASKQAAAKSSISAATTIATSRKAASHKQSSQQLSRKQSEGTRLRRLSSKISSVLLKTEDPYRTEKSISKLSTRSKQPSSKKIAKQAGSKQSIRTKQADSKQSVRTKQADSKLSTVPENLSRLSSKISSVLLKTEDPYRKEKSSSKLSTRSKQPSSKKIAKQAGSKQSVRTKQADSKLSTVPENLSRLSSKISSVLLKTEDPYRTEKQSRSSKLDKSSSKLSARSKQPSNKPSSKKIAKQADSKQSVRTKQADSRLSTVPENFSLLKFASSSSNKSNSKVSVKQAESKQSTRGGSKLSVVSEQQQQQMSTMRRRDNTTRSSSSRPESIAQITLASLRDTKRETNASNKSKRNKTNSSESGSQVKASISRPIHVTVD